MAKDGIKNTSGNPNLKQMGTQRINIRVNLTQVNRVSSQKIYLKNLYVYHFRFLHNFKFHFFKEKKMVRNVLNLDKINLHITED